MAYNRGVTETNPRRLARKRKKLTLQQLADEIGVSLGQMSRIERFGTPSLVHAAKLADRLRLNVRQFLPENAD